MTYIIPEGMDMDRRIDSLVRSFMRKSPYRAYLRAEGALRGRCARFVDTRFPHLDAIGSVYLEQDAKLVVDSRLIVNERYSGYSRGRHTVRSQKEDKTLKNMLQYLKPWTMHDSWSNRIHKFTGYWSKWREGPKDPCINMFRSMTYVEFFDEILRVDREGTPFSSPKFLKCIETGKESFAEAQRRGAAKGNLHYVYYTDNGVTVLTGDLRNSDKANDIQQYQTVSEMPEIIQERVPLLKMVGDNEHIDEIGVRITENEFFVIELLESNVG
jgi:hypothetical protein